MYLSCDLRQVTQAQCQVQRERPCADFCTSSHNRVRLSACTKSLIPVTRCSPASIVKPPVMLHQLYTTPSPAESKFPQRLALALAGTRLDVTREGTTRWMLCCNQEKSVLRPAPSSGGRGIRVDTEAPPDNPRPTGQSRAARPSPGSSARHRRLTET